MLQNGIMVLYTKICINFHMCNFNLGNCNASVTSLEQVDFIFCVSVNNISSRHFRHIFRPSLECREKSRQSTRKINLPAQISLLHSKIESRVHKYIMSILKKAFPYFVKFMPILLIIAYRNNYLHFWQSCGLSENLLFYCSIAKQFKDRSIILQAEVNKEINYWTLVYRSKIRLGNVHRSVDATPQCPTLSSIKLMRGVDVDVGMDFRVLYPIPSRWTELSCCTHSVYLLVNVNSLMLMFMFYSSAEWILHLYKCTGY